VSTISLNARQRCWISASYAIATCFLLPTSLITTLPAEKTMAITLHQFPRKNEPNLSFEGLALVAREKGYVWGTKLRKAW